MLTLEITSDISQELIEKIVLMDHDAYPPDDQMTWDRAYMIYGHIKDSLILLKEDGRLIGFVSIYGIRPDLVPLAIKRQRPIFAVEEKAHLLPVITEPCDGYLHNIILCPEYRGRGYRRFLYLGLKCWLDRHERLNRIWADAVSENGRRALDALGLVPCPELKGLWGGEMQNVYLAIEKQLAGIRFDPNTIQEAR